MYNEPGEIHFDIRKLPVEESWNHLNLFYKKYMMKKIFLLFALCGWLAVYGQSAKVDAIGITVSEMDKSLRFYQEVLGFKKLSDQERYGTAWENLFGLICDPLGAVKGE